MARAVWYVVLAVTLASSARQASAADLNYTDTLFVKPGEVKTIIFEAPLVDKSTITVKSPGVPVSVHIVFEPFVDAAKAAMLDGKPVKAEIVGLDKTEEKVFEFAPGKKPFAVLIATTTKAAEVKVTARGK
jgi:hypothetical protein